tara:strand:+ start:1219 stop:1944 length:726 start_codon:yes stop_codon:yes gene_type:complete
MFCNHKQVGRSRVNKVREGKKNPPKGRLLYRDDKYVQMKPRSSHTSYKPSEKTMGQIKKKSVTGVDMLFKLQKELFKEGFTMKEYENYIQEKINNDKYYYKSLSEDDVSRLHKNYRVMVMKKVNENTAREEDREMKKKQIKNFKEKRREMVEKRKVDLISDLVSELKKTNALGISKNVGSLNITPDNWKYMKYMLFTGGRYLESHDKAWRKVYSTLVSPVMAHLFNKHANYEINQLVYSIS